MSYPAKWSVCTAALMLQAAPLQVPASAFTRAAKKNACSERATPLTPASATSCEQHHLPQPVSLSQFGLGAPAATTAGATPRPGKEIAIMGLETGTGFVDITDPLNPVIIGTFSAPPASGVMSKSSGTSHTSSPKAAATSRSSISPTPTTATSETSGTPATPRRLHAQHRRQRRLGYIYRSRRRVRHGVGLRGANGAPAPPAALTTGHSVQPLRPRRAGRELHHRPIRRPGNRLPLLGLRQRLLRHASPCLRRHQQIQHVRVRQRRLPEPPVLSRGWLSEDRKYFYVNDELDEGAVVGTTTLHIFNVEDLENIFYVRAWSNGNTARDHNLYVKDNYIYAANYRSGLRIHDISDPENPSRLHGSIPTLRRRHRLRRAVQLPILPIGQRHHLRHPAGPRRCPPALDVLTFNVDSSLGSIIDPAGGNTTTVTISERNVTSTRPRRCSTSATNPG